MRFFEATIGGIRMHFAAFSLDEVQALTDSLVHEVPPSSLVPGPLTLYGSDVATLKEAFKEMENQGALPPEGPPFRVIYPIRV